MPSRMYTDAERASLPRARWDLSHWIDYVETAPDRAQRLSRHAEAPPSMQESIARTCNRRRRLGMA